MNVVLEGSTELSLPAEEPLVSVNESVNVLFRFYRRLHKLLPLSPSFFLKKGFIYSIDYSILSPATKIVFDSEKYFKNQICLKSWQGCKNGVYDTEDINRCNQYLLEGLAFNRRHARDVYIGIVPVLKGNDKEISCGPLIKDPCESDLKPDVSYALVMQRLNEQWRLDHHLQSGGLGTVEGMRFLAQKIAQMHRELDPSARKNNLDCIFAKLSLNVRLFNEALDQLTGSSEHRDLRRFRVVGTSMQQALVDYAKYFQQRFDNVRIKRCHGDLKAVNLWVRPAQPELLWARHQELLALDCVDFNPDFCHIDTLSDVAMLAIDIEMRLTYLREGNPDKRQAQELTEEFLHTYLREYEERGIAVRPLLEYYMTEKAMVCAYMSILYDGLPSLGKKYLEVAYSHSQKLKGLAPHKKAPSGKHAACAPTVQAKVNQSG